MDFTDAIHALRRARDENASIGHEPVSWFLVDAALAALDAAQGEAVLCEVCAGSGSVQAHMNGRDNNHPCPRGCKPAQRAAYNEKRIAWELERTALGDGFYGNSLRVAKDLPGVTADDRALLDRFATGMSRAADHVALQALAMRIYAAPQAPPAQPVAVPADNVTPLRQPRLDLARLVDAISATVYDNGKGLSVTEAIGALELAKLELLKEQEQ